MKIKSRICRGAGSVVFQNPLSAAAVFQGERSTRAHAHRSGPLRETVVSDRGDSFGIRARHVRVGVIAVIVSCPVGVLHFVGAGIIGVVLGCAATRQIQNISICIIADGIGNANIPSISRSLTC